MTQMGLQRLIGGSPAMERLRNRVSRVARTPLPVLLSGETGTGKEVAARAVHELSGRKGPFIPVDCAALSSKLIEAELFGYEKGAFTGANSRREGLVAAAKGGTFFLDEVGELPLELQTRLLRLLEQGTYRPVGSQTELGSDIRIVAATWRDLRQHVVDRLFREDLYHRLTIVELSMPPLRDRGDDIMDLLGIFVEDACREQRRSAPEFEHSVRQHLLNWPWPGNVRELKNTAAYVVAMTQGGRVRFEDLPANVRRASPDAPVTVSREAPGVRVDLPYMEARRRWLDLFQERYVRAQVAAHDGNISAAARACGMDRRSIQRILSRLDGTD